MTSPLSAAIPAGDPADVAELARLDREIGVLLAQVEQARQAWSAVDSILRATMHQREIVADRLRAAAMTAAGGAAATAPGLGSAPPAPAGPVSVAAAPPWQPPEARPETSTRTVQNVLFILGGLLLGTAAIVFTAVAWATFGVRGRAGILAVVTALALAAPLVALRRRLTATAETFAGLGLLLVVLDGYAAWYVNLFGVKDSPFSRYAGIVALVTVVVASLYRSVTKLVGPVFVALVAVQPVLPLFAAETDPSMAGWSAVIAGSAVIDLAVVVWWRRRQTGVSTAVRATAWILYSLALATAALVALVAQLSVERVGPAAWAGAAMILAGVVFAAGAALTRATVLHALSGCLLVLAVNVSAAEVVAIGWPDYPLVLIPAVVATAALLTALVRPVLPAGGRPGPRAGALVAAGALAAGVVGVVGAAALATIGDQVPFWHSSLTVTTRYDWQLLAAIGLVVVAFAATLRRSAWPTLAAAAIAAGALALPGSLPLLWWQPSFIDLLAATLLAALAVLARTNTAARLRGAAALVVLVQAVLTSLGRSENTAAVLAAVAVLGAMIAMISRLRADHPDRTAPAIVGRACLTVAMLAVAPAVGAGLTAASVQPWWVGRATAFATVLVVLALAGVRRAWPRATGYAFAATLVSIVVWPTVVAFSRVEPVSVYGAIEMLLLASTVLAMHPWQAPAVGPDPAVTGALVAVAALPGAGMFVADVAGSVASVLLIPYSWLGSVWLGHPADVGLLPADVNAPNLRDNLLNTHVLGVRAVALGIVALATAILGFAVTRRIRSTAIALVASSGPTAVLVGLAAAAAPWPIVAAATLLLGLVFALVAGLAPARPLATVSCVLQSVVFLGAGIAGALPTQWSTLTALGACTVAFAVIGVTGRAVTARVLGWLASVVAALLTAITASIAADLRARDAAFCVLGVAALALAVGALLRRSSLSFAAAELAPLTPRAHRRARARAEAGAVETAAHASAVVALALTAGSTGHAAAVSTLWGLALGLRALWPGTTQAGRRGLAAGAAAWELLAFWLLLAARQVTLVEAYTVPLAGVALLAGFAALRSRPQLRSWVAYGPALAAAFLPSLAMILGSTGEPWRRLALGTGAVAVVVAGAMRRRQAPVVVGGVVAAIIAIHEIALSWDLLPRWIPLAIGGVVLLWLAITYERRRRDMARLRGALGRMR